MNGTEETSGSLDRLQAETVDKFLLVSTGRVMRFLFMPEQDKRFPELRVKFACVVAHYRQPAA